MLYTIKMITKTGRVRPIATITIDDEDETLISELIEVHAKDVIVRRESGRPTLSVRIRVAHQDQVGCKELSLARWLAGRYRGQPLARGETVVFADGDSYNMTRANLTTKPPKGLKKGEERAWIVEIKGGRYLMIRNKETTRYITLKGRTEDEAIKEWMEAPSLQ